MSIAGTRRTVGAVRAIMFWDGRFGRERCSMLDLDDARELLAAYGSGLIVTRSRREEPLTQASVTNNMRR